jgi:hypothetical protein
MLIDRARRPLCQEPTMSHARPPFPLRSLVAALAALALFAGADSAPAQVFTRVSDPANPLAGDAGGPGFSGASWIDADGNGWPDVFVSNVGLYLNHGGGVFSRQAVAGNAGAIGNSWADYDNDGDADLMLAGGSAGRGSRLFRNDGGGAFTRVTAGATGDSLGNAGWACAWGDYDADGFVDLVIAAPFGFTGTNPNRLLRNAGNGTLVHDGTTDVTVGTAPYTVPTWSDFDLDGDLDLSIGAGPANGTRGPDYFYRNLRLEGGAPPLLDRITTGLLATQTRDGQVINWPDYDNDGDLDCFITNYRTSANHLYRNDGGGSYVRLTAAQAGPIAGDAGWNLSSTWNDFDNDGDLDCYLVRTSGFANRYYRNEGDGTFVSLELDSLTIGSDVTAVAADYDHDGDVDLFRASPGPGRGLYANEPPAGRHWFQLRLVGVQSNRSAIGAKARLTAIIGGEVVTQLREVSSQNAFNGHSDFVQHFGLGDAPIVSGLSVEWPGGLVETFASLPADTMLTLVEGEGFPTPTRAALLGARFTARGAELEWYGSELEPAATIVHRRPVDGGWTALGPPEAAGPHRARFVDPAVGPGAWAWRLGRGDGTAGDVEWLTEEAWLDVPAARLGLRASAPSALGGRLRLEFTLPHGGAPRAEVFDVAGRRVAADDLGARDAGSHTVDLPVRALPPGIYWVRLAFGPETVAARVVVLPGQR